MNSRSQICTHVLRLFDMIADGREAAMLLCLWAMPRKGHDIAISRRCLARRMGMRRDTTNRLLAALCDDGYARLTPSPQATGSDTGDEAIVRLTRKAAALLPQQAAACAANATAAATSLDARRSQFHTAVAAFAATYPAEMLRQFEAYWTEPNRSGSRMRFEGEPTWSLGLRLARWHSLDAQYSRRRREPSAADTRTVDNDPNRFSNLELW